MALGEIPCDQLREEEETWAWFMNGSAQYSGSSHKKRAVALQPISGASSKKSGKGKSVHWAELQAMHLVVNLLEKRITIYVIIYQFMGCGQWLGWIIRNWREHDWKIDDKVDVKTPHQPSRLVSSCL